MKSDRRTKSELIKELASVRTKVKKLETQLKKRKRIDQDITERLSARQTDAGLAEQAGKREEEALRESEERWRSLVSNSPDFIALHDREGRYLFLNRYAEGFTEKDVLGKKGFEFVSQESRELYRTTFDECIRSMTKQLAEYNAMGDSAKMRMYESIFVPIIGHGNEINVLVVAKDITERKQTEEELRKYQEQLRSFALSQQTRIEEERTRIAREIHDDLGQLLTAIKMDISMVGKHLSEASNQETREMWGQEVEGVLRLIDRGISSVRKIVRDLRPEVLDTLGIIDSIKWQAEEFTRRTNIPCAFQSLVERMELDTYRSTALFRIAQESLLNITKHARATHVEIVFSKMEKYIILEIRDNGCGFVPEEINTTHSFGLLGIRERVRPFGGIVGIHSASKKGTTVTITLPV